MPIPETLRLAVAATLLSALAPAAAQQLENSQTKATSGTVGLDTQGRASGANLSAGDKGPASETTMAPPTRPQTGDRTSGGSHAGGGDATKELFQH